MLPVHVIDPRAVYTVESARKALGLRESTIRREVREGRLRIARRAGKYFLLGAWLLEWIEGGEIRRRNAADQPAPVHDPLPGLRRMPPADITAATPAA